MTTPLLDADIEVMELDDSEKACENTQRTFRRGILVNSVSCDQPATRAMRFRCCGAILLICNHHWEWYQKLSSRKMFGLYRGLQCHGCGRMYRSFEKAHYSNWLV